MYNIYLLDDEKWVLDSLQKAIDWKKYNIKLIGKTLDSETALDEIQRLRPDIVITDIRMPRLSGLEMIARLSEMNIKPAFILLTGHSEFEYIKEAMKYNAVSYCLKPIDVEEVEAALSKAIEYCRQKELIKSINPVDKDEGVVEVSCNETLQNVCQYIKNHFTEDLSLQFLADHFFLNFSYLSSLFSKELGVNYSTYISNLRLELACSLLENTNLPVSEVASRSGFANYYYFARIFKKKLEATPSEYREARSEQS